MKTLFFSALLLSLAAPLLIACASVIGKKPGIEGYLYKVSGNQMPSPDVPRAAPQGTQGTIYIYELTGLNQVTRQANSSFYSAVSTRLVKMVLTKKNGHFRVKLPPGKYSIFLKADSAMYANRFDGNNNINPVEVLPNKITRVDQTLDNNAVY